MWLGLALHESKRPPRLSVWSVGSCRKRLPHYLRGAAPISRVSRERQTSKSARTCVVDMSHGSFGVSKASPVAHPLLAHNDGILAPKLAATGTDMGTIF